MADSNSEPTTDEEEAPVKKPSAIMGLVKAIAFISVVVLVEVVAASMILPSAQDAESTARQLGAAEKGEKFAEDDSESNENASSAPDEETMEVDLGQYNVTRYNPASDKTLIVDFELFGVVLADEGADFTKQFEANKVRLREQVIMTLGAAEATDLSDANLGLLKRRILEKSNRALGRPLVREVLFSKFNFAER